MITSVLLLALPISVIGTEFTRQWLDFKVEIESRKERTLVRRPRCRAMFKALKHQKRIAQEAQQDVRFRALKPAITFKPSRRSSASKHRDGFPL